MRRRRIMQRAHERAVKSLAVRRARRVPAGSRAALSAAGDVGLSRQHRRRFLVRI